MVSINEKMCFAPRTTTFNVVIITGVCRSGKTLLARLVGSMSNVEYLDEPWLQETLPLMPHIGYMDRVAARHTMVASTQELMNDSILYRQGNFRPTDLSTVWNTKHPHEILHRLVQLQSRDDVVAYIAAHDSTLLLVLADTPPFIDFFYEAFPACKVIHMVRNGFDVATEVAHKQWYATATLQNPAGNVPYRMFYDTRRKKDFFIPWWVAAGNEARFLAASPYAQGLYYWQQILTINDDVRRKTQKKYSKRFLSVRYEDLVTNPKHVVAQVARFMNVATTGRTTELQAAVHKQSGSIKRQSLSTLCDQTSLNNILSEFNYPLVSR